MKTPKMNALLRTLRTIVFTISVLVTMAFYLRQQGFAQTAPKQQFSTPPQVTPATDELDTVYTYFYFSDLERSRFNEYCWFLSGDQLHCPSNIRIHTNADFFLRSGSRFDGLVTAVGLVHRDFGVIFNGTPAPGYIEGVAQDTLRVSIASRIRYAAASGGGNWLNSSNNEFIYGLWFHGNQADEYRWENGTQTTFLRTGQSTGTLTWLSTSDHAIFCDGQLWVSGAVSGRVGIGAHGTIMIMDNLTYYQGNASHYPYTVTSAMTDMMTVVSEAGEYYSRTSPPTGIVIANTWENGRENGGRLPDSVNEGQRDVALHGLYVATNACLTFEEQNDTNSCYQAPDSLDLRGNVYLMGALYEHRGGILKNSNHGGTGYTRKFTYDARFTATPPPYSR